MADMISESTVQKTGSKMEQVGDQLKEGGSQLREKAGQVVQGVQDVSSEARRMAAEQIGQLRDSASQYLQEGRTRVQQMSESLETQIVDQPMRSVLIAAGVGFLLGVIWMRR